MNYIKLRNIKRLYFPYQELCAVLDIAQRSARVFASRYVKEGYLVRPRRNIYVLKEKWDNLTKDEKFMLANLMEVPSYISLMTAMDYYGITSQVQRDFFESISIQRTKEIEVENAVFNYTKISKDLYFGFVKKNNFFIATLEKAFLDAVYLASLKRYTFDFSSIDFTKLDKHEIKKILKKFPTRVGDLLHKLRGKHVGFI